MSIQLNNSTVISPSSTIVPPSSKSFSEIVLALCVLVVSLATVAGNVLVLTAFVVERSLRVPANYFVASLAVTDVFIGAVSMNYYTFWVLLKWSPVHETTCVLWLALDYTLCLCSQYTVFFITVDRFCSVTIPTKYRNWRTEAKVCWMVVATWVLPTLIFFPLIIGWHYATPNEGNSTELTDCQAGFLNEPKVNVPLTLFYYWLTVVVMCGLYVKIYRVAADLQRKSDAKRLQMNHVISGRAVSTVAGHNQTANNSCNNINNLLKPNPYPDPEEEDSSSQQTATSRCKNNKDEIVKKRKGGSPSVLCCALQRKCSQGKVSSSSGAFRQVTIIETPNSSGSISFPATAFPSASEQTAVVYLRTTESSTNVQESSPCRKAYSYPMCHPEEQQRSSSQLLSSPPHVFRTIRFIDDAEDEYYVHGEGSRSSVQLLSDIFPEYSVEDSSVPVMGDNTNSPSSSPDHLVPPTKSVVLRVPQTHALSDKSSSSRWSHHFLTRFFHRRIHENHPRPQSSPFPPAASNANKQLLRPDCIISPPPTADQCSSSGLHSSSKTLGHSQNRARKALRTIGFILGAFLVCWTPYHVFILIRGWCHVCVPDLLYSISYWLCYLNSPINPFCYAFANVQFKRCFLRILRCDFHRS